MKEFKLKLRKRVCKNQFTLLKYLLENEWVTRKQTERNTKIHYQAVSMFFNFLENICIDIRGKKFDVIEKIQARGSKEISYKMTDEAKKIWNKCIDKLEVI